MNSFPSLFLPLPTPEEMRQWEAAATAQFGIPSMLLMENASREAQTVLAEHLPLTPETRVLVVMGRGNNGGDGAALARHLHDAGCKVLVCHTGNLAKLPSPAKEHVRIAQQVGVNFLPIGKSTALVLPLEWRIPEVVIDALTGTGIRGDLREKELLLVHAMNALGERAFVLSLDIPSGLCGYTGKPRPEAVRADVTVTFEAGKPGLYFPGAGDYTGKIVVRSVGIPSSVRGMAPPSWRLLAPRAGAWGGPSPLMHKGDAGKVLVIGGSQGMAGAPLLSALGALHAGAGLVHVACPAGLEQALRAGWPELLTHPVGKGTVFADDDALSLASLVRSLAPDALVLGPGMGRTPAARKIVKAVLQVSGRCPALLDADALYFFHLPDYREEAIRQNGEQGLPMDLLTERDIVTPHPGEMARMLPCSFFSFSDGVPNASGSSSPLQKTAAPEDAAAVLHACIAELEEDRAGAVRAFSRACEAVLVLKGPGTLIGQRGRPIILAPFATAALAVGGSGDVLAGACAAMTAQGCSAMDAACLGVYLHGRAGELLAKQAPRGHPARAIAAAIPLVWAELCGA